MRYVLDTNIVARLLDDDARLLRRLAGVSARDVGLPLLVLAELLFGAEKSNKRDKNSARIHHLTERFPVLPVSIAIVRRYAAVRASVERRGRRKSDFDLVIACTALEHEATLVTNDGSLKDGAIEGLVVENWLDGT